MGSAHQALMFFCYCLFSSYPALFFLPLNSLLLWQHRKSKSLFWITRHGAMREGRTDPCGLSWGTFCECSCTGLLNKPWCFHSYPSSCAIKKINCACETCYIISKAMLPCLEVTLIPILKRKPKKPLQNQHLKPPVGHWSPNGREDAHEYCDLFRSCKRSWQTVGNADRARWTHSSETTVSAWREVQETGLVVQR